MCVVWVIRAVNHARNPDGSQWEKMGPPDVREPGGKSADDVAGLENRHPFERRLGRDADVCGERGGVERLRRASGAEAQKPEEIGKMADIEQIADVSFQIGLDIKPKKSSWSLIRAA